MMFLPFGMNTSGQEAKIDHSLALNATSSSLSFSTFLGGSASDDGYAIAVGSDGSCYVTGSTYSSNFPTLNAYNDTYDDYGDVFVTKFSSSGSLLWSTFLGGKWDDQGTDIAVSSDGSCYVTGLTMSDNFPTLNAYQDTYGDYTDAFVVKFSSSGSLLWSTYFGGSGTEDGYSIALSSDGSCYVTGNTASGDFPTLNAYNNTNDGVDAYVAKFSTSGSLLWSTYLGGKDDDLGYGIDVTSDGSCYTIGFTKSTNFPTLNAYNDTYGGSSDVFITKFSSSGSLVWSTYLGGKNNDFGYDIAVDDSNSCYVTGETESSNFPILNAYDSTIDLLDVFVAKFSSSGSLLWSTFLGDGNLDTGYKIAIGSESSCYIAGYTRSIYFPTLNAFDSTFNGGEYDAFISKFSSTGSLLWSTFLGGNESDYGYGIAVSSDNYYVTGSTLSSNFPTLNAYNSTKGSNDAFVSKFSESSTTSSSGISAFSFLEFLVILPILMVVLRKRRN